MYSYENLSAEAIMSTPTASPTRPARILIVDDHPVVRQGLTMVLGRLEDLTVCGEVGSLAEALVAIKASAPDIILTDLDLDGASGLDLIKAARETHPDLPVLVLSMHDEELYAERVLRAGGRGFLMKNTAPADLLAAIRAALSGEVVVSEAMKRKILANLSASRGNRSGFNVDRLTDRELQVFRMLGDGLTTRGIAEKLTLSVKTIEAHMAHLKRKLGSENGKELQRQAFTWSSGLGPAE